MEFKVFGHGISERGHYRDGFPGRRSKPYDVWYSMLSRCYSEEILAINPSYVGCSVCDEWLYFKNFAPWFYDNYRHGFALDKDIINPGNKIYSPDFCDFVPIQINTMLTHAARKHTKYDLPTGVSFYKRVGKYKSAIQVAGKTINIGYYSDPESARAAYLRRKKIEVIKAAENWRSELSERMYQALLVFPVEMEK